MKRSTSMTYAVIGLILLGLLTVFCQNSKSVPMDITLAAVMITIGLLATGLVMEYLAVLIFLSVVILLNIAPAAVTFSGFTSPAFWLTFAGIPLGMGIKKTGLADRAAHFLVRFCRGRYFFLVTGMAVFGLLMAFIMPSAMGRMMLIVPILIAFAEANGFKAGSKGYNGLLLAGVFGSYMPGFAILPSNLPNVVLMGSVTSLFHINLNYASYLYENFPVLGIVKVLLMIGVVSFMFQDAPGLDKTPPVVGASKFSWSEKRLTFYLTVLLFAWFSDSITQLSPAWPALVIAVICLLPGVGVLNHKGFMKEINVEPLFFVAGLVSLSMVLSYSGLGMLLGQKLISIMPFSQGHPFANYYLLSLMSALIGIVTTSPGMPAVTAPLASSLAQATGLPLNTVLMTQVIGFSMFILPYQGPPLLVAMRLGNIPFKAMTKLCLIMFGLSVIALLPLQYLWWEAIRMIN